MKQFCEIKSLHCSFWWASASNFGVKSGSFNANHSERIGTEEHGGHAHAQVGPELDRELGKDLGLVGNIWFASLQGLDVLLEDQGHNEEDNGLEDGLGGNQDGSTHYHSQNGLTILLIGGPNNGIRWRNGGRFDDAQLKVEPSTQMTPDKGAKDDGRVSSEKFSKVNLDSHSSCITWLVSICHCQGKGRRRRWTTQWWSVEPWGPTTTTSPQPRQMVRWEWARWWQRSSQHRYPAIKDSFFTDIQKQHT